MRISFVVAGTLALLCAVVVTSTTAFGGGGAASPDVTMSRGGLFAVGMDGRPPAVLPSDEADLDVPAGKLSNVPAWTWCYGCMNTAAAIIMGYHDRHGYPNMYAGNAGQEAAAGTAAKLCPQNNETA